MSNNPILDELNSTPGLREKVNDKFMEKDFSFLDKIYIDLTLLKDIRMGLMIGLAKSGKDEAMFNYLKDGLRRYNMRPNRTFTIAYPDLKYSEEQLQQMYKHVRYHKLAITYAPDTIMLRNLIDEFNPYFSQNDRAGYTDKVVLTINVYPLDIKQVQYELEAYKAILTTYLGESKIEVRYISQDPSAIPAVFYLDHKILYIDDLTKVLTKGMPLYSSFEDRKLMNYRITSPIVVEDAALHVWKRQGLNIFDHKQLVEKVSLTECVLAICCIFEFKPFHIPLPEDK